LPLVGAWCNRLALVLLRVRHEEPGGYKGS
jgi:hypothetical protein